MKEKMDNSNTNNSQNGAFPCVDATYLQEGLTKREYFAGLAMQGLMSETFKHDGHELTHAETIARRAIRCADELLKQLEK